MASPRTGLVAFRHPRRRPFALSAQTLVTPVFDRNRVRPRLHRHRSHLRMKAQKKELRLR
jgi:hypothetical protein